LDKVPVSKKELDIFKTLEAVVRQLMLIRKEPLLLAVTEASPKTEDTIRLCICDDGTAEDSAVFQIICRFIDLIQRISPGHELI
jgi:hypothetical protein